MHVESFGIALAICPRDDVRGAEQHRVGDSGEGIAPLPIIHQAVAKNVLPDPLQHESFSLCRARGSAATRSSNSGSGASDEQTPSS